MLEHREFGGSPELIRVVGKIEGFLPVLLVQLSLDVPLHPGLCCPGRTSSG